MVATLLLLTGQVAQLVPLPQAAIYLARVLAAVVMLQVRHRGSGSPSTAATSMQRLRTMVRVSVAVGTKTPRRCQLALRNPCIRMARATFALMVAISSLMVVKTATASAAAAMARRRFATTLTTLFISPAARCFRWVVTTSVSTHKISVVLVRVTVPTPKQVLHMRRT